MNAIEKLIDLAFEEDIGSGDVTTENLVAPDSRASGQIVAKEALVLAGLEVARMVFERLDPHITWQPHCADGDAVTIGTAVLTVSGKLRALLTGERV
ncbi:MAG: nicotinate-nucleotide diphosphorylase (carboxylating), partial [Desulfobacterales bacterium]